MQQTHIPCPDCGSSDAMCINDDGSTYCFSCQTFHKEVEGIDTKPKTKAIPVDFLKGQVKDITERCLNSNTCQKYSYRVSTYKDRPIHIATYRDFDGTPKFQKIRFTDNKEFFTIGKAEPLFYGCNLFKGNNKKLLLQKVR